jgi:glycosyltransferase involved in cell wall biosynthesis
MKIGIDARTLSGNRSGVGNYLANSIEFGAFDGHTVFAYYDGSSEGSRPGLSLPEQTTLHWRPLSAPAIVNRLLGSMQPIWWINRTLYNALLQDDVDAYFGPNFVQPISFTKPSVLVVHDVIYRTFPTALPWAYRWYLRAFLTASLWRANHVLTVSEHSKCDLMQYHDVASNRTTVAYGAANTAYRQRELSEETRTRLKREYDLPDRFVLYVGNLEPRKNVAVLFDALSHFTAEKRPPLVIVGKKQLTDDELSTAYERCEFKDVIRFTGYVSDEDLPLLYNMASVFVFPSLYEGFGLPVLEAMQSGVPVVTSDRSSIPEVVGNAGVTVDPRSPEALSNALGEMWTNADVRDRYRTDGLQRAAQFSWEQTADRIAAVFENLDRQ